MSTRSAPTEHTPPLTRSSHTGTIVPLVIIAIATAGLLLPMDTAFRTTAPLSEGVVRLQLEWLRLSLTIEDAPPAAVRTISQQLEESELRELSRFSVRLAEVLRSLPPAVAAVERSMATGADVPVDQMLRVDSLLSILSEEAEALDAQRDAAYTGLLTFGLVAAAGFAALWVYQSIRVNRLTATARESSRISGLERRVRDQERSKLARDLHDGVAQELAVAGMAADLMAKERSLEHLPSLVAAIGSARDEVRLMYRAMDPRISTSAELPAMLRELAAGVEQRSGLHFDLSIDPLDGVLWDPESLLHVFRIVQECMHNVVRHAHASTAIVSLRVERGQRQARVVLRVEDNGVGAAGAAEGYGRSGVRERVELLRGTVQWLEREPRGTRVEVVLPIEEETVSGI